jgi:hypothetical protein
MAVESTEKLSRSDRELLERTVHLNVRRQVTSTGKQPPTDVGHQEETSVEERTQNLIKQYDDYIAELDRILEQLSIRCKNLVYEFDPTTEVDCSAVIQALFEGPKTSLSYDDYKKILDLEAALSRELVAEEGELSGIRVPR